MRIKKSDEKKTLARPIPSTKAQTPTTSKRKGEKKKGNEQDE